MAATSWKGSYSIECLSWSGSRRIANCPRDSSFQTFLAPICMSCCYGVTCMVSSGTKKLATRKKLVVGWNWILMTVSSPSFGSPQSLSDVHFDLLWFNSDDMSTGWVHRITKMYSQQTLILRTCSKGFTLPPSYFAECESVYMCLWWPNYDDGRGIEFVFTPFEEFYVKKGRTIQYPFVDFFSPSATSSST